MFTDQIPDKPRFSNISVPVAKPELANPTPLTPMPDDHTEGWGLSFSINHFPESTGRAAGSASWEGLANLFWFADRKNNIGGIIASQILPYGVVHTRSGKKSRSGVAYLESERDAQFNALIDVLHSVKSDIFDPFTIIRTYYESAGIQIGVDILIPRRLKSHSPPVIVRIHGGFLITGSSLFPAWFSKWVLDFAEEQDAVIISPNYRLLPEVKGRDIIHDMGNFWNWLHSGGPSSRHFAAIGQQKLQLDLIRTLVVGESAGFVRPKAIIALYPMVDMKEAHFTESYTKSIVGVPNYPNEDVNKFLSATVVKPAITEADPPLRLDSAMAVVHNGRYLELLGEDPDLFILDGIRRVALTSSNYEKSLFPPLFLLHGEGDTAVPIDGTRKLVDCLQRFDPSTQIHLAVRPGDHGFDFKATIDEHWLREGLNFITVPPALSEISLKLAVGPALRLRV
ncbi:uncharacterized protein FTJAE_1522 [Fusarium tjaetaba]|uniref:Alpha/beta hydrolase fold-3 domain-containing protein n=1 Tax=Fusarium tjaetaba TaxID=1567544 RepID=A0A8H5W7H2_9HYPO|nr:uncharacterized protein FTJAE_1522 [Fusarium tjaetaba]KAF5647839.1 hypothetical protein FTJAE_1522 [Fusarium tjaetaba]